MNDLLYLIGYTLYTMEFEKGIYCLFEFRDCEDIYRGYMKYE